MSARRGVSAQGVYLPGGCTWLRAVCLPRGVSARGVSVPEGGCPVHRRGDTCTNRGCLSMEVGCLPGVSAGGCLPRGVSDTGGVKTLPGGVCLQNSNLPVRGRTKNPGGV